MKKFLQVLNAAGYYVGCMAVGYAFGKIFNLLFKGVWTEEYKEAHPVIFWSTVVLYSVALAAFAVVWCFVWPAARLYEWIDSKIDSLAEEKEWD